MKYYAVATLKRGAIDPPERLSPWIEDAIFCAEFAAAQKRQPEAEPQIAVIGCRKAKNCDQSSAGNGERHESLRNTPKRSSCSITGGN
jgi:hypothetical protein